VLDQEPDTSRARRGFLRRNQSPIAFPAISVRASRDEGRKQASSS
jgi:hypothetical protein